MKFRKAVEIVVFSVLSVTLIIFVMQFKEKVLKLLEILIR